MIYPVVGEDTLRDLVKESAAGDLDYDQQVFGQVHTLVERAKEDSMTKLGLALTFAVVIMMHTIVTYAEGVPPDIEGAIEEEPIAEKARWVTLGIGRAAVPDYEGSEDYEGVPVPIVRVDWRSRPDSCIKIQSNKRLVLLQ